MANIKHLVLYVCVFCALFVMGYSVSYGLRFSSRHSSPSPPLSLEQEGEGVRVYDPRRPCGPVCIAVVASLLGKDLAIDDVCRQIKPDPLGRSSVADLLEASEHFGLSAKALNLDTVYLSRLSSPAIVHLLSNHFVTVIADNDDQLMVIVVRNDG